jgi:hypothetical protein
MVAAGAVVGAAVGAGVAAGAHAASKMAANTSRLVNLKYDFMVFVLLGTYWNFVQRLCTKFIIGSWKNFVHTSLFICIMF